MNSMKTTLRNIIFFFFAAFFFTACRSSDPGIEIRDAVLYPNAKAQDIFKKNPQQMKKSIGGDPLVDYANEMQIGGVSNMMETVRQISRKDDERNRVPGCHQDGRCGRAGRNESSSR